MSPHSPTIAVVGAGLAGLTTAYRLHQAGYEVEVYEAQNRIGGRAYSVYINGSINELGGNNIFDGGEALHLLNLAQEFGLEIETIDHHIVRSLNFNGKQYNNEDVQNHLAQLGDIAPAIHAAATTANNLKEIIDSVFANDDFLKFYFNDFLSRYEGADTSQLTTHSVNTLISFTQFIDTITFGTIKGGNALLQHASQKHYPTTSTSTRP